MFVASDSSALKTLLREKHAGRFAVSFFDSPGDRLKARRGSPISTSQVTVWIGFGLRLLHWLLKADTRAYFDIFPRKLAHDTVRDPHRVLVVECERARASRDGLLRSKPSHRPASSPKPSEIGEQIRRQHFRQGLARPVTVLRAFLLDASSSCLSLYAFLFRLR